MKLRWSIAGMTLLGIIAAFCATLLVASLGIGSKQRTQYSAPTQTRVVVAARPLPALSVLDADDLTVVAINKTDAPGDHFNSPVQVIGKVLSGPVVTGQAITLPYVETNGPGVRLSTDLPLGMRAVGVEPTGGSGLPGLLYPGCLVDVLGSFQLEPNKNTRGRAVSTTLLQGVKVLAVENRTVFSTSPQGKTIPAKERRRRKNPMVTLMVSANQAKILQLAGEHGRISLALRNPSDQSSTMTDPTLLKGGRLTRLAEILEAEARIARNARAADESGTQPEPIDPLVNQPAPSTWETTIIRGVQFEVRSLPLPHHTPTPKDNQQATAIDAVE